MTLTTKTVATNYAFTVLTDGVCTALELLSKIPRGQLVHVDEAWEKLEDTRLKALAAVDIALAD